MKYLLIVLAVLVLAGGGVLIGMNINNNKNSNSSSGGSNSSTALGKKVLDMSNKGLTQVGSDIYNQAATTDLILSHNSIKSMPSQMGKMTNLVVFKIDNNILEGSLIAEVRQMSKLKTLDVSYNNMTGMPAEIGQLSNLETLNYSHNKITGLPNELANLKSNLKTFDLTGNPLTSNQIAKLKGELPNTNIIF